MASEVDWYDFVCFGIVGVAFVGALWILYRKEGGSKLDRNTTYESLLVVQPDSSRELNGTISKAHLGASMLWTSCWKGVHPGWLLTTRFVSFLVMAGLITWDLEKWGDSDYMYYTEWTFTLVMFYFMLGVIVSAHGCWVHSKATKLPNGNGTAREEIVNGDLEESRTNGTKLRIRYGEEEFLRRAGFWGYMMQAVYQASAGAVVYTDIIFWCVIVPFLSTERLGLNWLMGCMHTLNAFFLLVDSALNSLPFPWFRFAYFVLWTCAYVTVQWIIHFTSVSEWPYPFLQLNTPWAPLWYFVLAVLHIPCYGIYALIIKAKNTILPRLCPHCFLRT